MFTASRTSRKRSCVSGRTETIPCWANAIAVASTAPIQIGRYLSPCASFSRTIGEFDGISTRTPTSSSSLITSAPGSGMAKPPGSLPGAEGASSTLEGCALAVPALSACASPGPSGISTPTRARTSLDARTGAPVRMASAMPSDGLELTLLPFESTRSASNIPLTSDVMRTLRSRMFTASRTSRKRSCVSGRTETIPCWANAIAVASTAPIQIGRYLSPCASFSRAIGEFDGISTRTPTSCISWKPSPSVRASTAIRLLSITPRALTRKRLQQPRSHASTLLTCCSPCL